jgi:cysteinyl-tRNA synthetase
MHNNMITIEGKKMGKSYGNFITLDELFSGTHPILVQPYSPMTIRFFILQAHYRSTLDFSNDALQAAEKGLKRIMQAVKDVKALAVKGAGEANKEIKAIYDNVFEAICDDINTPIALSHLFDAVRIVNQVKDGQLAINAEDKALLDELFLKFIPEVLGLVDESATNGSETMINGLIEMVLDVRKVAKSNKDFATSDLIRDKLKELGVQIKDTKDGVEYSF